MGLEDSDLLNYIRPLAVLFRPGFSSSDILAVEHEIPKIVWWSSGGSWVANTWLSFFFFNQKETPVQLIEILRIFDSFLWPQVVYSVANEGSRLEIPEGPLGSLIAGTLTFEHH